MHPWRRALYALLLLSALLLPRILQLDHFVTPDEKRWMTRAGNFAHGLVQGEFANTFQKGHPGVTTMWIGALGYAFAFPEFPYVTPGQLGTTDTSPEDFFATQGKDPLQVLAAGRTVAVLVNVLVIGLALALAARFLRFPYIGIGLLLVALDPFHMAHARLLHTDALLASFAFLTVVAYLCATRSARPNRLLILSGMAAGLTWLTKTPGLFLVPFVGLLQLVHFGRVWRTQQWDRMHAPHADVVKPTRYGFDTPHTAGATQPPLALPTKYQPLVHTVWGELVRPLLIWFGVAVITYVACWPAMWVAPLQTLGNVFSLSQEYAEEGHSSSMYFMGQLRWGDPGFSFYPISYLWRTTPVVLVGLVLAVGFMSYGLRFTMLRPRSAQVYDAWLTNRSRHDPLLPTPYSLLPTPYSLLPTPHSLLPTPHSLLPSLLGFALLYLLLMNLGAQEV
ncbi:MAG: phospholipid carrier-dependent glycosyltransferase [Caldilineaceae bacterium]